MKLYMTISDAAAYAGIGVNTMRAYVNSADPPPYLKVGNRVMIQTAALAPYLEKKQEIKA